eukprot:18112-Heterococcus_DN1.PRE.1
MASKELNSLIGAVQLHIVSQLLLRVTSADAVQVFVCLLTGPHEVRLTAVEDADLAAQLVLRGKAAEDLAVLLKPDLTEICPQAAAVICKLTYNGTRARHESKRTESCHQRAARRASRQHHNWTQ